MKQRKMAVALAIAALLVTGSALATTTASKDVTSMLIQEENVKCVNCHLKENNSLVQQWKDSPHAAAQDGQVGCFNCHAADQGDKAGYMHEGAFIKTIQSPTDCAFCHEQETKEMSTSHHATAGQIMASLDNVLGEVVCSMESNADAANGCWQCHGSQVRVLTDGNGKALLNENQAVMFDPMTYPNSGIGRLNPDGTQGSCNACHGRHSFRSSTARQPENCGKCHLGPDHPQMEAYRESKHGIAYYTSVRERGMNAMNILKSGKWVLGKDYYSAPTCATCHMGSTLKSDGSVTANTHNVGDRISWNLRSPISTKMNRVIFANGDQADMHGDIAPQVGQERKYDKYVINGGEWEKTQANGEVIEVKNWEMRREDMKIVCQQCHGVQVVDNFYTQYDELVLTYNNKFAKPAKLLFERAKMEGLVSDTLFDSKLGWYWWELWHHEGRRARVGASKMAPDYTHWHGLYEVAENFYHEFIPELLRLAEEQGKLPVFEAAVNDILAKPEHQWFKK
jgi:hydroxylamine dehydrogenase